MNGTILVSDYVEEHYGDVLESAAPGVGRAVLRPGGLDGDAAGVEIAYLSHDLYPERIQELVDAVREATNLQWLHSFSAGVDNPFFIVLRKRDVRVTNSSGAIAVPIAQTVLLYALALSRDLPRWLDAQGRRSWERHEIQDLEGRTMGVVGLGPIGLEVARLAAAFRMRVIGVRRTPRGDEPCETWTSDRLRELLPQVDYLALTAPLTDETRNMLDADALALMKPTAYVLNIARGELIDEPALVDALQQGRLAGAALDVFWEEPLPPDHPLWTLPNVIVTPHCSGWNRGNWRRATEIYVDNLDRYVRGEPLRNEIP